MQNLVIFSSAIIIIIIISIFHQPVSAQIQEVQPPQFGDSGENDVKTYQKLLQEQNQLPRAERRIQNLDPSSFFLPGLGVIREFNPQQVRSQRSQTRQESRLSAQSISPVSVVSSERGPPGGAGAGDECE